MAQYICWRRAADAESTVTFTLFTHTMEEGGKTKKTLFVGGIGEDVNEEIILEAFSTFGEPSLCSLKGC